MKYETCDYSATDRALKIKAENSEELHLPSQGGDLFVLLLLWRGRIRFGANRQRHTVGAPAAVCLDSGQKITAEYSADTELKTLYFSPSFLSSGLSIDTVRSGLSKDHLCFQLKPFVEAAFEKKFFVMEEASFRHMEDAYDSCKRQLELQPDWYWPYRARTYFMDMIQHIELLYYSDPSPTDPAERPDRTDSKDLEELKPILSYINGNLDTEISLNEVCQKFRTYRKRMEALFKTCLGITFYEYIQNQRYEKICYYLRFTDLKLKEIAFRTGISSPQNLCRFFKGISGKSPSSFRNGAVPEHKNRRGASLSFDACPITA